MVGFPPLTNKVAVVTGGRQGIGRAIALALAATGADIAICDRTIDDSQLNTVADEVKMLGQCSRKV